MAELSELIYVSMSATLQQLTALGEVSESSIDNVSGSLAQAKGALDLVNRIMYRMEMSAAVGLFINRLIELARKNKAQFTAADQKYYNSTVENVVTILQKQPRLYSSSSTAAASDHFADDLITSLKQLT